MNITTLTNKGFSARFFALLTVASLVMTVLPVAFFVTEADTIGQVDENMTIDVSPAKNSLIELAPTKNFVLTVDAADVDGELHSLEIDHSMEGNPATTPEFSVYANSENPYGGAIQKTTFENDFGVTVTYVGDENNGTWTIDFGETITDLFTEDGIEFYLRAKDELGERFSGPFNGTTPENTFAYTVSRAAVVEEEPRSSGGGGSSSGTRIRDRVEPTPLVLGVVDSSLPTDEELTGVLTSVSGILVAIQSGNEAGDISDEDAEKLVAQLSEILSILLRLY